MKLLDTLEAARVSIDNAIKKLNDTPNKNVISDLLGAILVIDVHYKKWCDEMDHAFGEPPGTAYKEGIDLEYEIEADWWHDVSVAFRKLKG